jgi:alpha-glucosidase (family GH31 glycosyl hydrolase)
MYNLGPSFRFDKEKALSSPKAILKGSKYRFTILNEGLIRLEYSKDGVFNDLPTELIWFRNFTVPPFSLREDDVFLEIATNKFKLTYTKNKSFNGGRLNPMANLKIEILGTDKIWHYNHPEARNYGAPTSSFDLNKNKIAITKGLYSQDGFISIDDSNSMVFNEDGTLTRIDKEYIDMYLFIYNKDFNLCLKDYFALTGQPALIPRYALGNWWGRNINYSDEGVKNLIEDFGHYEIPMSILLLNDEWHVNTYNDKKNIKSGFTWNSEYYKSPVDMTKYLHSNGVRLGLNIAPTSGIYPYEKYYEKAVEYLGVKAGDIIPFNTLDPKTLDVYFKLFIHPLDNQGVDFYWFDNSIKDKNILWQLNHYHFFDMNRDYKRRPLVLSENYNIASHRYPVLYSGRTKVDWETLKMIPYYNSLASHAGISFYSHDIGGYYKGVEDNELYVRFVQLGVFSPILKFGADKGKYYKREPWKWSIKTYNIVQDYLKLRHRLIPYLYNESYNYYKNGKPLIEPIYYKHPDFYDDSLYKNQYFLGSSLYISPIVNKKDHIMNRVIQKFYIPEGIWYDFVTGKKFPGGKSYVSFFKDQDYPVFAKAGAIIPLGENDNINDTTPPKNMEINIFPGKDNVYQLYEDDGVSNLYLKGYYLLTNIEYNYLPNNYTVIIRAVEGKSGIVPEKRNYKIRFRNTKKAEDVIAYFNSQSIECEKYVDGTDFIVEVKDIKTIGQLTINCKGADIEIDAVRIINEDIKTIISDLQIDTLLKEKIDDVLFSDLAINKKRIAVRKLKKHGLERKFIRLFLKLLEYINQV